MLKNKRILITGSEGFIGNSLVKKYSKIADIIGIDLYKKTKTEYNFISFDLTKSLKKLKLKNIDYIFHCASPVGVDTILEDPNKTLEDSIKINLNIHNICKKLKCRLIFLSTSEVYGNSELISISKNADIPSINKSLRGSYASQKFMSEFLFTNDHYNSLIIRLFNITGPTQDTTKGVIPNLINKLLNNEDCNINCLATRTFLHIDDFLTQFDNVIDNKNLKLVNIGDESCTNYISMLELFHHIIQIFDKYNIKTSSKIIKINNNKDLFLKRKFIKNLEFQKPTKKIQDIITDILNEKIKDK